MATTTTMAAVDGDGGAHHAGSVVPEGADEEEGGGEGGGCSIPRQGQEGVRGPGSGAGADSAALRLGAPCEAKESCAARDGPPAHPTAAAAAHFDPYSGRVVVNGRDDDTAFAAELVPPEGEDDEEELGKPVIDAAGVRAWGEVVDEERKMVNWRGDARVRRWVKGFVAAVAVVALGVGLGVGLTRTTSPPEEITVLEEEDICNYTNDRAPWLRGSEINDAEDLFTVTFNDGSFTPVARAFGFTVSLSHDGNRVAVSSRFGDAFHVYERNGEGGDNITKAAWSPLGSKIVPPPPRDFALANHDEMTDHSSWVSLSGDGNVVACGFPYYRTPAAVVKNNQKYDRWGAVVVYRYESGSWEQLGDPFVGEGRKDFIGKTMSLSEDGTILALGEERYNSKTGRVRVFQYTSGIPGKWYQIGDDIPGENRGDEFGGVVSLSRDGSMVASGSLYDGNGSARVFRTSGGSWAQVGDTMYAEEGYTWYGWPVSISGDGTRLAVSMASILSDGDLEDGGLDKGNVIVYEYADGAWSQLGKGLEGREGGDGLGFSLSLSADGTTLAAGASNSDTFGEDQGYARVYRYHCGEWIQIGKEIAGLDANGWTGRAIAISETGEHLAVGTPFDYAGEIASPGYVRIYESPFDVTYINSRLND